MNANAVEHETQRIAASKALDMVQQRLQTYLGRGDEKVVRDTKGDRLLGVSRRFRDIVTCEQTEMSTKYVF